MVSSIIYPKMKIFVDTSVLVEYLKGKHINFYEKMIIDKHLLFVNQVVVSEFLFHFIALSANKSPLSVKMSGQISESFGKKNLFDMLPGFIHLEHNLEITELGFGIMRKYNLLPNDALILASCKHFDIDILATHDSDFIIPCTDLKIRIINSVSDLENSITR